MYRNLALKLHIIYLYSYSKYTGNIQYHIRMYLIIHYFDINFDISWALDRSGFRTRSTGHTCHCVWRFNHSATGQGRRRPLTLDDFKCQTWLCILKALQKGVVYGTL